MMDRETENILRERGVFDTEAALRAENERLRTALDAVRRGLHAAKVALMNRNVLGNRLILEYEAVAASAEAEVDAALENLDARLKAGGERS